MLLPFTVKIWLEKQDWYLRIRYSDTVNNLWLFLRKDVRKELTKQKLHYLSFLPASDNTKIIYDIGANEGFITKIFADAGYKVIAAEPSLRNVRILRARFKNNPLVIILHTAVSDKKTQMTFFESPGEYALGTFSEKWKSICETEKGMHYENTHTQITTVTLDEIIKVYGSPAAIKIDVEGYEEKVLKGLTQSVPVIFFEGILPDFSEETKENIRYLNSIDSDYRFNIYTEDKLLYESFQDKEYILSDIEKLPPQTIEVICRNR